MSEVTAIHPELNVAMSLAGIFQAAALVKQAARAGDPDERGLRCSIASVLKLDSHSVVDIYGSVSGLNTGFRHLISQLARIGDARDPEITRYASDMIALERRFVRDSDLVERVQVGVRLARNQLSAYDAADIGTDPELLGEAVFGTLAQAYKDTVSQLRPRIMVSGDPALLNRSNNADRIRALLLAGIRSAVLWRQLGGSRRKLLFSRGRMVKVAELVLGTSARTDDT